MKKVSAILALLASMLLFSCEDPNQEILDDMEKDNGVIRIDIDYDWEPDDWED